jgi:hypothetical protein
MPKDTEQPTTAATAPPSRRVLLRGATAALAAGAAFATTTLAGQAHASAVAAGNDAELRLAPQRLSAFLTAVRTCNICNHGNTLRMLHFHWWYAFCL